MLPFMKSLGTKENMGTVWKRSLPCRGRIPAMSEVWFLGSNFNAFERGNFSYTLPSKFSPEIAFEK
jgi:hypothetical protein